MAKNRNRPHVAPPIETLLHDVSLDERPEWLRTLLAIRLLEETYEPDERSTRNRIAWLRRASNLTRADVADRLGVTSTLVRDWERGRRVVPEQCAVALGDLFGVSVVWLLAVEEPMPWRARRAH